MVAVSATAKLARLTTERTQAAFVAFCTASSPRRRARPGPSPHASMVHGETAGR
jgi:hypothetical protein